MKNLAVPSVLALLSLSLFSCQDEMGYANFSGRWKMISYDDFQQHTHTYKSPANTWYPYNQGDVIVQFENSDPVHWHITGVNVTNDVQGDFEIDETGHIVSFELLTTLLEQPDWADWFGNISKATRYTYTGQTLIFFVNHERNGITLVRR